MTPEERKAYMYKYYLENKSYIQRYKKRWYEQNRELINERRRKKYRKDSEYHEYEIERHRAKRITKYPVERTEINE